MGNINNEIELKDFISKTLNDIELAAGDRKIIKSVEFEVVVSKTITVGGNLKIIVAQGEGQYSKENVSKIKFEIHPYRKDSGVHIYKPKMKGIGTY